MIAPPAEASALGRSPAVSQVHSGLSTGSSRTSSETSSAGRRFSPFEKSQ